MAKGGSLSLPGPRRPPNGEDVKAKLNKIHSISRIAQRDILTADSQVTKQPPIVSTSGDEVLFDHLLNDLFQTPESAPVSYDGDGIYDSLFSDVNSDTFEIDHTDGVYIGPTGPHFVTAAQSGVPAMGTSLVHRKDAADRTKHYDEPLNQAHVQPIAHLHDLVAAAQSVSEQEQLDTTDSGGKRKNAKGKAKFVSVKRRKIEALHGNVEHDSPANDEGDPTQQQSSNVRPASLMFRAVTNKPENRSRRPGLGALYSSFRLSPDAFFDLQSLGKDFMLDPRHPERMDLIGTRDQTRRKHIDLKLFESAEAFLESGAGEKFFAPASNASGEPAILCGAAVNDSGPGSDSSATSNVPAPHFEWPHDRKELIALCVPLLRKALVNERQRAYAMNVRNSVRPIRTETVPVNVLVFFMSTDANGNAVLANNTKGQVLSQPDALDEEGRTQWGQICALLGLEALRKTVRIQTPGGMKEVDNEENCGAAIAEVLRVPWLERTVRIVVSADERAMVDLEHVNG